MKNIIERNRSNLKRQDTDLISLDNELLRKISGGADSNENRNTQRSGRSGSVAKSKAD